MGHKPFQELRDKMTDHKEIWLEPRPIPPADQDNRTWCQDNAFELDDYDGRKATRYIRADICDDLNNQLLTQLTADTKTIIELEVKLVKAQQTIERQRMQLAACSTVAYANTEKSAKAVRDMHPDYRCATVNDVCIAVDREMKLLQTIREISEFAGYEDDGGYVDRHELLAILNRSKS